MEESPLPLDWLSEQCAKCLRQYAQTGCEACRELAYRALCDGNDAAWDLLVSQIWPLILRWIYANNPELTPTAAEAVGYRLVRRFQGEYANRPDLAANFPTFPELLQILHRYLMLITRPQNE